jgi:hypothetical protein
LLSDSGVNTPLFRTLADYDGADEVATLKQDLLVGRRGTEGECFGVSLVLAENGNVDSGYLQACGGISALKLAVVSGEALGKHFRHEQGGSGKVKDNPTMACAFSDGEDVGIGRLK